MSVILWILLALVAVVIVAGIATGVALANDMDQLLSDNEAMVDAFPKESNNGQ